VTVNALERKHVYVVGKAVGKSMETSTCVVYMSAIVCHHHLWLVPVYNNQENTIIMSIIHKLLYKSMNDLSRL